MSRPAENLSDDELLSRTVSLVARCRRDEAALVAHLAEVDQRRLYLREACPSMFVYATTRLGLSEPEAYLRITVGRAARRYPIILELLVSGQLHVSSVARLAPHLTDAGAETLLARAAGRSKREIEAIVAALAPRPDARSFVRRIPDAAAAPSQLCPDRVTADASGAPPPPDSAAAPSSPPASSPPASSPGASSPPASSPAASSPAASSPAASSPIAASSPARLVPLAPHRFKVQFTASSELEAKLTRARELLRHQIPSGDLAAIFDRALTVLLASLERKKCAATPSPRRSLSDTPVGASSRHVPAAIRRAIWQRDGGQCTFVDGHGRRCPARDLLELHHEVPYARGGDHSPDNVRLLCRAHNVYRAELDYGRDFIRQQIDARRSPDSS